MSIFEFKSIDLTNAVLVPVILTVLLGGWLAIITANLIYWREVRAKLATLIWDLQGKLFAMNPELLEAYPLDIKMWFKEIIFINEELKRRGYIRLAAISQETCASIDEDMNNLLREIVQRRFPGWKEKIFPRLEDRNVLISMAHSFRVEAAKRLAARLSADANKVLAAPLEFGAILELPFLAAILERHGAGRRSDCDGKCSNCNRVI